MFSVSVAVVPEITSFVAKPLAVSPTAVTLVEFGAGSVPTDSTLPLAAGLGLVATAAAGMVVLLRRRGLKAR